jgi:exonuclease III
MGGDFNLILDKELDSMNYKNHNNPKATAEVLKLINILNLKDIFSDNHPDLKRYTWRRKNPVKQARLDFFLISESLQHMVPSINHENSYRSDHSSVVLFCKLNEFKKEKGFWKFNISLLVY